MICPRCMGLGTEKEMEPMAYADRYILFICPYCHYHKSVKRRKEDGAEEADSKD